jgi:hypothetical protein
VHRGTAKRKQPYSKCPAMRHFARTARIVGVVPANALRLADAPEVVVEAEAEERRSLERL